MKVMFLHRGLNFARSFSSLAVINILQRVELSHCSRRGLKRKQSFKQVRHQFSTHISGRRMPSQVANHSVITISVDGNISSGKSTLVSNLKELFPSNYNFQVELVPEPLDKWTNLRGHNLLGMFYEDLTTHNFMFQHYVQLTRLMEAIKMPDAAELVRRSAAGPTGTVRILERSLQNNRYCFTELARREGRLKPEEFAVLSEWHSWLEEKFDLTLDAIVYLRTDPQTVYNRMQKRGRSEESSVPMEYLKSLHETYEDWLIKGKIGSTMNVSTGERFQNGMPKKDRIRQRVIVIDGNQGIEQVAEECKTRLKAFMEELGHARKEISSVSDACEAKNNDVLA